MEVAPNLLHGCFHPLRSELEQSPGCSLLQAVTALQPPDSCHQSNRQLAKLGEKMYRSIQGRCRRLLGLETILMTNLGLDDYDPLCYHDTLLAEKLLLISGFLSFSSSITACCHAKIHLLYILATRS